MGKDQYCNCNRNRNYFRYACLSFICLYFCVAISAEPAKDSLQEFSRPKTFDFITNVPSTMIDAWKISFNSKPETLWAWGAVASSTLLLYIYDEKILNGCQRLGRNLHLGNDDHTETIISLNDNNIFRGPTDIGSTLYFLGDGWMHSFIGAGFLVSGAFANNNRALQTGSQIFNGLISATIPNQLLKRSFGRESPFRRTKERGNWVPFPNPSRYNADASKYDAMPSGHVTTATMTFTIIDANYPEYRYFIRPLAIAWITLLGFQMVNNGVHWSSDYPLAIAMGYVVGRAASKQGRVNSSNSNENHLAEKLIDWNILPIAFSDPQMGSTYGAMLNLKF
ncbi:MAG: phosphatase PAP2 family protein [Oligoflexia bacterium]|nr:phosphatase PAP2 family protein [Oligoflexia bacterium]